MKLRQHASHRDLGRLPLLQPVLPVKKDVFFPTVAKCSLIGVVESFLIEYKALLF